MTCIGWKKTLATLGLAATSLVLPLAEAQAKIGSCSDPIVFGTTISETGVFSSLADRWRKMTEVFAEEINKAGGVKLSSCGGKGVPVKWVIYDDQSVPATAVQLFERMATVDNVDFFVGLDWSSMGGPVPPVAEKHKIPLVSSNIATSALFDRGLKYFWATPFPVVPKWSERYFDMVSKMTPKPQSIFFVIHDNPVTKAIAQTWAPQAEKLGMKIVGQETFHQDTKDFTALITKIRSAKPDIIYLASFDNPSVPLIQQMRQLRVRAMDVHHNFLSGALARQLGKDVEGMTGEIVWYPGIKGPHSDFVEDVLKKSNIDSFEYVWTMGRMASYLIAIQALEKAGAVDREKFREAMFKGSFKTPAGDVVFDERGFPANGAFTMQLHEGKVKIVWPPEVATGKVIWPAPTWQ